MATTQMSNDLAEEVRQLESNLAAAEVARVRPEDRRAAEVRAKLDRKKQELQAQQAAEDQANQKLLRAQELETLRSIEDDQRKAHALLMALRAESVDLSQRIALTEFRSNELLRAYVRLKQQLGM